MKVHPIIKFSGSKICMSRSLVEHLLALLDVVVYSRRKLSVAVSETLNLNYQPASQRLSSTYITCSILSLTNELQFASALRVKTTWFRYFYCVISSIYRVYIVHDKHYLYLCSYSYPYLYEFILFRFAFVIGFLMTNLMMKFMLFRFSVCINYHLISRNETCATISWLPCLLRSVCRSVVWLERR